MTTIAIDTRPDASVLTPVGELDLAASPDLRAALRHARATGLPIVVDLSAVTFLDRAALGVVVTAHCRAQSDGCPLTLLDPTERVLAMLQLTGLLDLLHLHVRLN